MCKGGSGEMKGGGGWPGRGGGWVGLVVGEGVGGGVWQGAKLDNLGAHAQYSRDFRKHVCTCANTLT